MPAQYHCYTRVVPVQHQHITCVAQVHSLYSANLVLGECQYGAIDGLGPLGRMVPSVGRLPCVEAVRMAVLRAQCARAGSYRDSVVLRAAKPKDNGAQRLAAAG